MSDECEPDVAGESDPCVDEKVPKTYTKDFLLKFQQLNTEKPEDLPTIDELLRGNSAPLERPPPRGNDGRGRGGGEQWRQPQSSAAGKGVGRPMSGGGGARAGGERGGGAGGGKGGSAGGVGQADIGGIKFGKGHIVNSNDDGKKALTEVRSILNKLTPEKFDALCEKLQALRVETVEVFKGMVQLVFDKALGEPKFSTMYATLCARLAQRFPEFPGGLENGKPVTFKRVLLNLCHDEFQSIDAIDEGEKDIDQYEREERNERRRVRMRGNVKFIGELFKQSLLATTIMKECIKMLLADGDDDSGPSEVHLEGLTILLTTIGETLDKDGKADTGEFMANTFAEILLLAQGQNASKKLKPRERFMLQDLVDLRNNSWKPRQKVAAPTTLDAARQQAEKELGLPAPPKQQWDQKQPQHAPRR